MKRKKQKAEQATEIEFRRIVLSDEDEQWNRAIRQRQRELGRNLTPEELGKIASRFL